MRHRSILADRSTSSASSQPHVDSLRQAAPRSGIGRRIQAAALSGFLILAMAGPTLAEEKRTSRETKGSFANTLVFRSVSVTPDHQAGQLAGLYLQIQDESSIAVTGNWPVMIQIICDSGCSDPGEHVDPAEVMFDDSSGNIFIGNTDSDGTKYLSLTTAMIGAGINIVSVVLGNSQPVVSPTVSRYTEVMAGAGRLEYEDENPTDEDY